MNSKYEFSWNLVREFATYLMDKQVADASDADELAKEMLNILDEGLERAIQEAKSSDSYIRW